MEGNTTLIELQTPVFQAIPGMLEELDNAAEAGAVWVEEDTTTHLAALGNRGGYGRGGRGDRRGGARAWASRVGGRSTSQWGRQCQSSLNATNIVILPVQSSVRCCMIL